MNGWIQLLNFIKDKPLLMLLIAITFVGAGGVSVIGFATKDMVNDKHAIAMEKIGSLENKTDKSIEHTDARFDRLEDKIDNLVLYVKRR